MIALNTPSLVGNSTTVFGADELAPAKKRQHNAICRARGLQNSIDQFNRVLNAGGWCHFLVAVICTPTGCRMWKEKA
jgi:hypothetical protein